MTVHMKNLERLTVAEMEVFVEGSRHVSYGAVEPQHVCGCFATLENWTQHLKSGVTERRLRELAGRKSDTEAGRQMQQAKLALLTRCRKLR